MSGSTSSGWTLDPVNQNLGIGSVVPPSNPITISGGLFSSGGGNAPGGGGGGADTATTTPPPTNQNTNTNQGNYYDTAKNQGYLNGQFFNDYNKWLQAGGQAPGGGTPDYATQARNDINQGYNDYFAQLDQIMNNQLPASRTAQEGIAQSQGTQAQNTLGGQYNQGIADLAANSQTVNINQQKTLQNLADDIRNQFRAGQIYLGARGAGDSSAADQYSYAIAKMGNQARGGVLQQTAQLQQDIANKKNALTNTYNTELNNIQEQVNQKMLGIAQWFSDAQAQLQQAKAQGKLSQGQDLANLSKQLLQNATSALMMAQQEAYNRQDALQQWAMNNSQTIQGLQSNLAQISSGVNTNVNQPLFSGNIQSDAAGNINYQPGGNVFASNNTDYWKKVLGLA